MLLSRATGLIWPREHAALPYSCLNMSTHSPDRSIDRSQISKHPYSPSIASSVSSSASSIFSLAASVSSVASSIASLTSIQSSEGVHYSGDVERHAWSEEQRGKEDVRQSISTRALRVPPPAVEQRQHQRRTQKSAEVTRAACPSEPCPPPVPTLVRQVERKTNFVDNLVGTYGLLSGTV